MGMRVPQHCSFAFICLIDETAEWQVLLWQMALWARNLSHSTTSICSVEHRRVAISSLSDLHFDGSRLLENAALWKLGSEADDQKRPHKASLAVSHSLIAED